jgi:microcin C transport system substrate-binding protein
VIATRRTLLRFLQATLAVPIVARALPWVPSASAQQQEWRHGLSLFGELKYPAEFAHFDYVDAKAPKGGLVRQGAFGTYDNFNMVVAGLKGRVAAAIDLLHETPLIQSLDEVSSYYGLLAEAARHPDDFSSVTYRLRAAAKWHDGAPVTADDVVFSFDAFKKNNPRVAAYYRHIIKAEITGEREVTFTFDAPGNRELPQIVGQLTIVPKHWWAGTDKSGQKRDITATTLEAPLGSGPYRIKEFEPGRVIVLERVKDYWGKDLNVRIGQNNFDELRFGYFRDLTIAFESFKAGRFDWYIETNAKTWATGYDFPAVKDKRVVLEEFPIRDVGIMQCFAFNLRRDKFKDPRLRRAFNFALDFQELNKLYFYGQYQRIASYFEGTELACSGLPQGRELEILEAVRGQVPAEVFTTPYSNPVTGNAEATRRNLLQAARLLTEAGYGVRDLRRTNNATGEPLTVEFLVADPGYERFVLFYQASLLRLGIQVTVRAVDDVQYANRLRQWDFDIVVASWPESLSPGNEQRDFWGARAADTVGSRNLMGIKNPAVDALIDRIVFAKDRDDLVAATRAMDRVLLWNHYCVPQWTYRKARTARWDRYARPEMMPKYGEASFPTIWWWDAKRAAATNSR